jgi:hypothetical protein
VISTPIPSTTPTAKMSSPVPGAIHRTATSCVTRTTTSGLRLNKPTRTHLSKWLHNAIRKELERLEAEGTAGEPVRSIYGADVDDATRKELERLEAQGTTGES